MICRPRRGFGELLDDRSRRRDVGVAEPEIDDVAAFSPQPPLQLVDGREDVRRQVPDAAELHRARLHRPPEDPPSAAGADRFSSPPAT